MRSSRSATWRSAGESYATSTAPPRIVLTLRKMIRLRAEILRAWSHLESNRPGSWGHRARRCSRILTGRRRSDSSTRRACASPQSRFSLAELAAMSLPRSPTDRFSSASFFSTSTGFMGVTATYQATRFENPRIKAIGCACPAVTRGTRSRLRPHQKAREPDTFTSSLIPHGRRSVAHLDKCRRWRRRPKITRTLITPRTFKHLPRTSKADGVIDATLKTDVVRMPPRGRCS